MIKSSNCFNVSVATAVFVCLTASAWAETLQTAVGKAIDTNPELGAIRHNRLAIDQELRAARGLKLPTMDVRGEYGRHNLTSKSPLITNRYGWHNRREIAIVASQRLFDGWEAAHEVARQKHRVQSARYRVADTANAIALRAIQAYLEIERARAVLRAAERNLGALDRLRSRVFRRVSAGQASRAERTEAGSRFANAKALAVEARARLADAEALYVAVVGEAPRHLQRSSYPKTLPTSLAAAIDEARQLAPSVLATDNDRVAAEAAIGVARSRYYPKINAEVSAGYTEGVKQSGDHDRDVRAMVVARWNLFNGGIDTARVREARSRASEAREISANTTRIVIRETRTSWNALTAARLRIPALKAQLDLARATRATYNQQYDSGARRLLDLLDAQSEVFVADAALETEKLVGKFSAYRLLAAIGRLVAAMELNNPEEAELPPVSRHLDGWGYRIFHGNSQQASAK